MIINDDYTVVSKLSFLNSNLKSSVIKKNLSLCILLIIMICVIWHILYLATTRVLMHVLISVRIDLKLLGSFVFQKPKLLELMHFTQTF